MEAPVEAEAAEAAEQEAKEAEAAAAEAEAQAAPQEAEAQAALEADGQAAAREVEAEAASDRCHCSGNCGWKVCKSRQGKFIRGKVARVCLEAPRPGGGQFCTRCRCQKDGCMRPRLLRCERQWCSQHGKAAKPWDSNTDWSLELNLVALVAPVLLHLEPDDITCLTELGQVLGCAHGTKVRGMELFFLVLGHAVKWPPQVRMLVHCLARPGTAREHGLAPPEAATQDTEQDFKERAAPVLCILRDLLKHAEHLQWESKFSGWRVGTLDLCTGLGPLAVDLGLLARRESATTGPMLKLGITTISMNSMVTWFTCDYFHALMIRNIIIILWRRLHVLPRGGS